MGDGQLEALAERAASGDSAALSRLVEEVQHPIYRLALRFLGHPEDAKDATQEILVRLITHLGQFEGRSQSMTWAYTIDVRQLVRTPKRLLESAVKGAEAFAAALDRGLADRDFTAEEAEYRLLSAEVRISCTYAMLLCLSRPLRASYILGDAMGMPDIVAAEICGITPAAQRQRLARARRTQIGPGDRRGPTPGSGGRKRSVWECTRCSRLERCLTRCSRHRALALTALPNDGKQIARIARGGPTRGSTQTPRAVTALVRAHQPDQRSAARRHRARLNDHACVIE